MTTTIQYKTLSLAEKPSRDSKTFSKAETVYSPYIFDEHLVNLVKASTSLAEIEQSIFEEKILRSLRNYNPVYSFVWFLN